METISGTNERRSGLSNAKSTPPATASAYSTTSDGWGEKREDCERRGLSHLEALRHQQHATLVRPVRHRAGPRRERHHRPELAGRERADGKTAVLSFSTNRMSATLVSQLPVFEISWPMKKSRKL